MAKANINVVRRQVSSLLNAAGWKMSALGAMALITPTKITGMTDCSFVAGVDEGKSIAIDLGDTLGIFVSTIAVVDSTTAVTMADAAPLTGAITGASVSYGGRLEDDRHNLQELREAVFEADDEVYILLGETYAHWARPEVETPVAIMHNAQLPPHVGVITTIMILVNAASSESVRGKRTDFETVQRLLRNTGVAPFNVYGSYKHDDIGSPIGGYYHIDGSSMAFFTGTSATGLMLAYTDPRTSGILNSPASLTGLLVFNAAVRMYKQGAVDAYVNAYNNISMRGLAGIKANSRAVPDPASFEMPESQTA